MCVSAFAPTPHALITPIAAIVARFVARRPRAHRPRLASPSSFFFPVASPARRAIVLSFRARVRVASLAVRSLARSSVAVCRRAAAPSPPPRYRVYREMPSRDKPIIRTFVIGFTRVAMRPVDRAFRLVRARSSSSLSFDVGRHRTFGHAILTRDSDTRIASHRIASRRVEARSSRRECAASMRGTTSASRATSSANARAMRAASATSRGVVRANARARTTASTRPRRGDGVEARRARRGRTTTGRRRRARADAGADEIAWCCATAYTVGAVVMCARAARARREDEDVDARDFAASLAKMFAAPCALYGILLARSWTPETLSLMMPGSLERGLATGEVQFVPTLRSIMTLLSARATATSAWAHLLCVNLFVARHVALKTRERNVRDGHAPPIAHTLVLSTLVGPLALLSHVVTDAAYYAVVRARDERRRATA
jgi:hypothetical protein